MSCYTRHLQGFMSKLGLEDSRNSRRILDGALRSVLGYSRKEGCPFVWEEVKRWLSDPQLEEELLRKVKERLE